jgi:hypothetical protein
MARQQRRYYRLWYPPLERPKLLFDHGIWHVVELSEGGARILSKRGRDPEIESEVAGLVEFADRGREYVRGLVLRHDERDWVVEFARGISFARMMEEQRRVFARYPDQRNGAK